MTDALWKVTVSQPRTIEEQVKDQEEKVLGIPKLEDKLRAIQFAQDVISRSRVKTLNKEKKGHQKMLSELFFDLLTEVYEADQVTRTPKETLYVHGLSSGCTGHKADE